MKWATRAGVHIDRAACAWLIRRFLDPAAQFVFVGDPAHTPADATGFDMRGAALSHHTNSDGAADEEEIETCTSSVRSSDRACYDVEYNLGVRPARVLTRRLRTHGKQARAAMWRVGLFTRTEALPRITAALLESG